MDDVRNSQATAQVELVRSLQARSTTASPPSALEVQQALETSFSVLISLEARLQRVQNLVGGDMLGAEQDLAEEDAALRQDITELRDAITDLREATQSDASSPLALGFVLPENN